ncbi:hypothetical protein, partial [Sphingomonas sp. 10B4]
MNQNTQANRMHRLLVGLSKFLRKEWLAYLILVIGLGMSVAVWVLSLRSHEDVERARFISTGELITTSLE